MGARANPQGEQGQQWEYHINSRLVEFKRDDILGETLGFNKDQLASLFKRTFGPSYLDNYQKSLTWQHYRGVLSVHGKLSRHRISVPLACPRSEQDNESVLHALVQCLALLSFIVYVDHALSHLRRVQLSAESIIKIVPPSRLSKGR